MSHLRENLQYLRAQRGMSQAQLAARLDVSRQSVAKWEAEKSYPEMEKLIKICEIFGCSMDGLVRGDLAAPTSVAVEEGTERVDIVSEPPTLETSRSKPETTALVEGCAWADYDTFMMARARTLALAAFLPAIGFSAEFFTEAVQADLTGEINQLGPILLTVCIAFSVALGVAAHRARTAFITNNESVVDPGCGAEAVRGQRKRSVYLSLSLVVAIALASSLIPGLDGRSAYASAAYWLAIAIATGLTVNSWVRASALDTDRYNKAAKRFLAKKDSGGGRET